MGPPRAAARRPALLAARAGLVAGPTVLAFLSGGYFTGARLAAGIGAWLLLALALAATGPRPAAGTAGPAGLALGALALLTVWTAVSASWAPLGDEAADALERAVLYLGALAAVVFAFGPRRAARTVEPALAAGAVVVLGYGLAGRLLPTVVEQTMTASAGGRLDQPLTYWNATGALAAIGFVLCARLGGDRSRPVALRAAAAASTAPLGLALYLTFSRGSLSALAVGIAVLVALAPTWAQLRSIAIALEAAAVCAGVASLLPDVRDAGDVGAAQGAVMLAVLLAVMAAAALMQVWSASAESAGTTRLGPLPRTRALRTTAIGAAVVFALVPFAASAIAGGERPDPAFGATAERLASADSRRFDYWEAALRGFVERPLAGHGAGSFAAVWLRERDVAERARDAHSLPLETAVELGLVGLALLLALVAAVVMAAARVHRDDPALATGPAAALAVYGAHAAIDWDWQMPAVTLVAVVLAGVLLAAGRVTPGRAPRPPHPTASSA